MENKNKKIWTDFLLQVLSALLAALTAYLSVFILMPLLGL